jgi:hypothetical protein
VNPAWKTPLIPVIGLYVVNVQAEDRQLSLMAANARQIKKGRPFYDLPFLNRINQIYGTGVIIG